MSKKTTNFKCSNCNYISPKLLGKCPSCNEFGTMTEIADIVVSKTNVSIRNITSEIKEEKRLTTNSREIDRVFGDGGILIGSYILLAGEPGIGKSTITLQICKAFAEQQKRVLYISGEESETQVASRSARICGKITFDFLSETELEKIEGLISSYDLVIIDSIQTIVCEEYPIAGTPNTVRFVAGKAMEICKHSGTTVIAIGHVTKDGNIAGPQTLSHLVDVVAILEGGENGLRILRSAKNRFGSTDEIGMFEMQEGGMIEIKNPSRFLLSSSQEKTSGNAKTVILEGKRPLIVEIQALTIKTAFGYPKRVVAGFNLNRLSLLIAVLEKHAGISFSDQDVYINVVGGLHAKDRSADLAICAALISSRTNKIIAPDSIFFSEVGLSGEIRKSIGEDKREKEALANGFKTVYTSKNLNRVGELKEKIMS